MSKARQGGFTLIEIAIVLVIIGLLLGGVLKGQELITSARVRNLIAQQDGIKAAFFGFQDRFRAYPGDYSSANTTLKCPSGSSCLNGNGNGIVEKAGTCPGSGIPDCQTGEHVLAWMHLASAGFLNGSYTMNTGETASNDNNTPKNPYNIFLELTYDNVYADTNTPPNKHNLKTGAQVPVEIISEVDRKIDDGNGFRGGFRYSVYQGNAPAAPPAANDTPGANVCIGATTTLAGVWHIPTGATNCGGASLF